MSRFLMMGVLAGVLVASGCGSGKDCKKLEKEIRATLKAEQAAEKAKPVDPNSPFGGSLTDSLMEDMTEPMVKELLASEGC